MPGICVGYRQIFDSVVQSILASLPELKPPGLDTESTPVIRHGHFAFCKLPSDFVQLIDEQFPFGDDSTLHRNPRPQLTAARAQSEIFCRFNGTDLFGDAVDFDLPLKSVPRKQQGDMLVARDLRRLATEIVGKKNESRFVEIFEQYAALRWSTLWINRRKHHGIGFQEFRCSRLLKPRFELFERTRIGRLDIKRSICVLLSNPTQIQDELRCR